MIQRLVLFGTPVVLGFGLLAMVASARAGSVMASALRTANLLRILPGAIGVPLLIAGLMVFNTIKGRSEKRLWPV